MCHRCRCREDHNATSYSTETPGHLSQPFRSAASEDHNATSYSTETQLAPSPFCICSAKIITLRAIALKLTETGAVSTATAAKIITLRAIALKPSRHPAEAVFHSGEDHNATSYSTETQDLSRVGAARYGEDHNATSYSTETRHPKAAVWAGMGAKIITLRAIALKQLFCGNQGGA